MSGEEQIKEIGRIVFECSESTKEVELLESRMGRIAEQMKSAGSLLGNSVRIYDKLDNPSIDEALRSIPPSADILDLLVELRAARTKNAELLARKNKLNLAV